jgi:hypothetical protein
MKNDSIQPEVFEVQDRMPDKADLIWCASIATFTDWDSASAEVKALTRALNVSNLALAKALIREGKLNA